MLNLKIKFELNKDLDKHMIWDFLSENNSTAGGIDFATEGIFKVHPDLLILKEGNKTDEERWQIICDYVDEFYDKNINDLNLVLEEVNKNWQRDEIKFFDYVERIFKNPEIPEGKYIGYLSIINCNPRFLDSKTFQIFYKHRAGTNYVIAHEVLHFFFMTIPPKNILKYLGN